MNLVIDAGGTNLRAKLYDNGSRSIGSYDAKSKEVQLGSWIERILEKESGITSISISFAGQVNDGRIIASPNINVDIYDIKEYFEKKHGIALYIENDLKCAALAEAKEHESENLCALYIGTGIGLGVIENGRLIKGCANFATEIGHIPFEDAPFKCGCGKNNCIELFASGSGIDKWMRYHDLRSTPTLQGLKEDRNPNAKVILKGFEKALLYAAGCAVTLFNPSILVLGGGIIEANPYLVEFIASNIDGYALKSSLECVNIIKSDLQNAPLIGANLLKESYV